MKIKDNLDIKILKDFYFKIFKDNNPFGDIFYEKYKMLLLYPSNGFILSRKQFNTLIKTLKYFDEEKLFLSEVEIDFTNQDKEEFTCNHFMFNSDLAYEEYDSISIFLENALYSPSGIFGIIISQEEHAILGATKEFMNKFKEYYDKWEEDLKRLRETMKKQEKLFNSKTSFTKDIFKALNLDDK